MFWIIESHALIKFDSKGDIWDDWGVNGIFKDTMEFMGQLGFYVSADKEILKRAKCISKYHRCGRYDDLEFKSSTYPAGFKIEFFQNRVFENPYGGYYDFDKFDKMPYLIKLQFKLTTKKIAEFLSSKGYEDKTESECPLAVDKIKRDYKRNWYHHFPSKDASENFNLCEFDGATNEYSYNREDRDGEDVRNGEVKYFRDRNGYLSRGKVYHNLNNMWWVITDKHTIENVCSRGLFDLSDGDARRRIKRGKPPEEYLQRKAALADSSDKELIQELRRRHKVGNRQRKVYILE